MSMLETPSVETVLKARGKSKKSHPLGLLISVIRETGGTDKKAHLTEFANLLNEDGYEDFRNMVIAEWFTIKYSTAYEAANPPSKEEIKKTQKDRKQAVETVRAAVDAVKKTVKKKLIRGALNLMMPNGKRLGKCTGLECIKYGGWVKRIGERVGPDRLVGDVLSNKQLAALFND